MRRHALALLCLLAACGGPREPAGFAVALIAPGSINDHGWNAAAFEGLGLIERELSARVLHQEVTDTSRHEPAFRALASDGVALIIGHGSEFLKTALAVAPGFPGTAFVVSAGTGSSANVASVIWRIEDAAYMAGALAARMSRTGKAGCVGGMQYPLLESVFHAFASGARSVNPGFDVRTAYVQSWSNFKDARTLAESMIDQGCDFLFHNADEAGLGVLKAAEDRNVLAFGCTRDQSDLAPAAVLASVAMDVAPSFVAVAREVQEDRFTGRIIEWTRRDGFVRLVFNSRLADRIPADARAAHEELDRRIAAGEVRVPYDGKPR
jgi:basic membrane lipoprotein Med (substrate-binding protein (PBP1-ABC) superfamily)